MIKFCSLGFWYAPGDVGLSLSAVLPRKQTPPICHFLLPSGFFSSFPLFLLFFQMLAVTVSYCHQSKVSQAGSNLFGLYQNTTHWAMLEQQTCCSWLWMLTVRDCPRSRFQQTQMCPEALSS